MDQKVDSLFNLMDVNRSGTLEMVELGDLGQVIQREYVVPPLPRTGLSSECQVESNCVVQRICKKVLSER